MRIPVILGTAREGRQSEKVATFLLKELKKAKIDTELLDVRDYRLEATDNTVTSEVAKRFEQKINSANALIIVSPEYNHSYPGELKMMLDLLYQQYTDLPVGFAAVSSGNFGGAHVAEKLKTLALQLNMVPINYNLHFPNVGEQFSPQGDLKNEKYYSRSARFIEKLKSFSTRMKGGD